MNNEEQWYRVIGSHLSQGVTVEKITVTQETPAYIWVEGMGRTAKVASNWRYIKGAQALKDFILPLIDKKTHKLETALEALGDTKKWVEKEA